MIPVKTPRSSRAKTTGEKNNVSKQTKRAAEQRTPKRVPRETQKSKPRNKKGKLEGRGSANIEHGKRIREAYEPNASVYLTTSRPKGATTSPEVV